ncbi:MAG TPA: class I SAM-dependent methyltransferase [Methanoregulaceae archaeon]|nr:class I SAM-dependent methyltransferase [Methanoregulaceae archaeon]
MTEFEDTSWVNDEFTRHYLLIADAQIPQRSRLKKIIRSFYRFHVSKNKAPVVLDLGSGDGVITGALLEEDPGIRPVFVDASEEMINRARQRFSGCQACRFINRSFNELLENGGDIPECDFIISSLAIHHIGAIEKGQLFRFIYEKLKPGCWFLLFDSVLPPASLEDWYITLWLEWIRDQKAKKGIEVDMESFVYSHHQAPDHHKNLDSLGQHLSLLEEAGFSNVDIIYKYGVFSLLCGEKSE